MKYGQNTKSITGDTHRYGYETPHSLRQVLDAEGLVGVWRIACRGEQRRVVLPVLLLGLEPATDIPATSARARGDLTTHHHRLRRGAGHAGVGANPLLHAAQLSDGAASAAKVVNGGSSLPHTSPGGPQHTPAAASTATPSIFDPWHAGIAEGARHGYALPPDGVHIAVSASHAGDPPINTVMLRLNVEPRQHLRRHW